MQRDRGIGDGPLLSRSVNRVASTAAGTSMMRKGCARAHCGSLCPHPCSQNAAADRSWLGAVSSRDWRWHSARGSRAGEKSKCKSCGSHSSRHQHEEGILYRATLLLHAQQKQRHRRDRCTVTERCDAANCAFHLLIQRKGSTSAREVERVSAARCLILPGIRMGLHIRTM